MERPTQEWLSQSEKKTLFYRFFIDNKLLNFLKSNISDNSRLKILPLSYGTTKLMEFAASKIKPGELVLDAGAGECHYKKYFNHAKYESCDFDDSFDEKSKQGIHTFICNIEKIPRSDNYYDAIINTNVLEHVENPQKVIDEFYRILKPGGKLFLDVPQGLGVHGAPYNYFNFLIYGLESIFKKSGFKIIFIKPIKGIFCHIGKTIGLFGPYIMNQYLFKTNKNGKSELNKNPLVLISLPFYAILYPILSFIIPYILFHIDFLDKKKDWTIGYVCYCIKPFSHIKKDNLNEEVNFKL